MQERRMMWDALESTVDRVFDELLARDMHQQPFAQGRLIPSTDYLSLYQQIYTVMCQDHGVADKYGMQLYKKYEQLIQRSIHSIFQIQVESDEKKGSNVGMTQSKKLVGKGEEGIETFLEGLKVFKQKMLAFSHIFAYMERYFIPRKNLATLEEVSKTQFNQQVLKRAVQQLKNELVALAEKRRDGNPVNDSLFVEVVPLFLEGTIAKTEKASTQMKEGQKEEIVGAYEDFETLLLHKTILYYANKATQWPLDTLEKKVEQALIYEKDFAEKFLLQKSWAKFEEGLKKKLGDVISSRMQTKTKRDETRLSSNFESNINAPTLNCSTHHKIQDVTKSSIVDTFRTTNV